jgi:hypothetical protein
MDRAKVITRPKAKLMKVSKKWPQVEKALLGNSYKILLIQSFFIV